MPTIEVLLREDVDNLGHRGQVVKVRAGYSRNYLIPQKLAVLATGGNLKLIDQQRRSILKRETHELSTAQQQAEALKEVTLTFVRKVGENDTLFGSVTSMDVANALHEKGYELDRRKIVLHEPIKMLGEFQVPIKLYRDVKAEIKVVVAREE